MGSAHYAAERRGVVSFFLHTRIRRLSVIHYWHAALGVQSAVHSQQPLEWLIVRHADWFGYCEIVRDVRSFFTVLFM